MRKEEEAKRIAISTVPSPKAKPVDMLVDTFTGIFVRLPRLIWTRLKRRGEHIKKERNAVAIQIDQLWLPKHSDLSVRQAFDSCTFCI